MKSNISRGILAAMVMAMASVVFAAPKDGAPPPSCEPGAIKLATGPVNKGYDKIGKNIVAVGAPVCIINTEGSLDNLGLLTTKKAEVAIATIDNMKTLANSDENVRDLQVLMPLHSNYLHVVVTQQGFPQVKEGESKYMGLKKGDPVTTYLQVRTVSQLRGLPVGLVGSSQLLMRQLDKQNGMNLQVIDFNSDAEARAALTKGQIAAWATMAAWPAGPVDAITSSDGLALAGFDLPVNQPYQVKPLNYKRMGVYNVQMLGVQNVLVSRKFEGARKNDVLALRQLLVSKLTDLKDGDFEPAWNEIKDPNAAVDWPNVVRAAAPAPAPSKRK